MGKIVSIHSFRGGTGKSNTTANLAALTAMAGHRVGIVDTDIQSPGIHVLFGLSDQNMGKTLNEYLRGECSIEDVAFNIGENPGEAAGRQKLVGKDLWLIPSSIKTTEIHRVLRDGYDANKLNEGLQTLIKNMKLDYLFIDTHPGINDETLLSLAISDILILLMRPDQQDFQGTIVTVDVARMLDVPRLLLAVNKVLSKYDFNQVKAEIEGVFNSTVAGIMPLTEDLVELASSDLIALKDPDHPWSKAIKGVSQAVMSAE
jgi:MinD-like ATPase involved in chromosome partitioning or flagellar assembly